MVQNRVKKGEKWSGAGIWGMVSGCNCRLSYCFRGVYGALVTDQGTCGGAWVKTPVGPYSEPMGCGNVGRYKGHRLGL